MFTTTYTIIPGPEGKDWINVGPSNVNDLGNARVVQIGVSDFSDLGKVASHTEQVLQRITGKAWRVQREAGTGVVANVSKTEGKTAIRLFMDDQEYTSRAYALSLLRQGINDPNAQFRAGQWEAIDSLVNHRRRVLVVERTGWGKSMVYFLATRILRDKKQGPTLIISPLLALMRNQVTAAQRINICAETINSTNSTQWSNIGEKLKRNEIDLLLISPERLANERFLDDVFNQICGRIGLFVVDEVHCISDWGHDFRPDYRRISLLLEKMPPNMPIIGTTATANDRVISDIKDQLGKIHIQRGELVRESLILQTISLPDQAARLAWLAEHLPRLPGTGIIYVLTKRDAESVTNWLASNNIDARAYYSGVKHTDFDDTNAYREHLENLLFHNKIKVLVATSALGMGYDKPDVGFAIHYQTPGSVISYYQQVGRAGRALSSATGVLLAGKEDAQIIEYFRNSAFPSSEIVTGLLDLLQRSNGLNQKNIEQNLNLNPGKIRKVINYLSVQTPSPILEQDRKLHRTAVPFQLDVSAIQRLTEQRESEWLEMNEYIQTKGCRMAFLQHALNDTNIQKCGRCDNCLGRPPISLQYNKYLVFQAQKFLRQSEFSIEPRKQIQKNACPKYGFSGNLATQMLSASQGKVLSRWADAGWGSIVKDGKNAGHFSDDLVQAILEMIKERWKPTPSPEWLTCIPSYRNPRLVSSFSKRLAEKMNIPFIEALTATGKSRPQKEQQNSFHQCNNLDDAFVVAEEIPESPVFLIDDIVDSRWTFTIAAALLKRSGSGDVYPVALTSTANS